MIVIDKALEKLEKSGKPIRIGLVGFGFAGQGFAMQIVEGIPGMKLVAVANRTQKNIEKGLKLLKVKNFKAVATLSEIEKTIKGKTLAITTDFNLLADSKNIDVIVEATGEIEFGAQVAMAAIRNKKHIILLNAELDATLGPILKKKADKAGVMFSQAEGDQPAVLMRIYRYVKQMGFKPVMVGNIKSLIDARRTPITQAAFAKAHWQRPKMITSFADGSKIAFEMATIANATGFPVAKRGMQGLRAVRVEEAVDLFDKKQMLKTGLTDYILGAEPSFGVFVIAYSKNPIKRRYMQCYKMGNGPFYTFYTHCHLSPIEAPITVAQSVIFKDASLAPIGAPVCEVITLAKKDLKAGEVLDAVGGFTVYGALENHKVARKENLIPQGLTDGAILKRDIKMDEAITFDDVILPEGRLADKLWNEQITAFK